MIRVRLLFGAILVAAISMIGCSKNPQAPAKISGSVTYNGQPVKGGTLVFHTPDGVAYPAKLLSDGTYSVTDIPEGELVVTLETESINPARKAAALGKDGEKRLAMNKGQTPPPGRGSTVESKPEQFYIKIPAKYAKPNSSPLTVQVRSGRQVHNLELVD